MPAIAIATNGREKQKIDKITEGHTPMCGTLLYLACHIGVNCPICESPINVNRHSENNESIYFLLMVDTDQELAEIFGKCIGYELTRVLIDVNARSLISKHIFKCPSCEKELQNPQMNRPVKKEIFSNSFGFENGVEEGESNPTDYQQPSTSPTEQPLLNPVEESNVAETVSLPSYSDHPDTPVEAETTNILKRPYPYHVIEALNAPPQPVFDNNMYKQPQQTASAHTVQYARYSENNDYPHPPEVTSYNDINANYKEELMSKFEVLNRVYKWREGKSFVAMCKKCNSAVTAANSSSIDASTKTALLRHLRLHVMRNPYICSYCSFSTKYIHNITNHINESHRFQPVTFTDESEEVVYLEECLAILYDCFDIPEGDISHENDITTQVDLVNRSLAEQFKHPLPISSFPNTWMEQLPNPLQNPQQFPPAKSLLQQPALVKFEGQKGGHYEFSCTLCNMLISVRSVFNYQSSLHRLLFVHYNNAHPQIPVHQISFAESG